MHVTDPENRKLQVPLDWFANSPSDSSGGSSGCREALILLISLRIKNIMPAHNPKPTSNKNKPTAPKTSPVLSKNWRSSLIKGMGSPI